MSGKPGEDLLEKGFQLAYFIAQNRAEAVQILSQAMCKLRARRSREKKRTYWRDKFLKGKITRIVRDDRDMLQWLIYFESEYFEKQQELAGTQTTRDMIVRYIKHLAQLTTAMSSFYVNVGLQRLLHNYSTSEAQRVYERVTQHYPGAEEYRKVKGTLMSQLEARFQNFVRTSRGHHGELRFDAYAEQAGWAHLVEECLRLFAPWSQACVGMAGLESGMAGPSGSWPGPGRRGINQDAVETYRCHLFIDPCCFGRLAESLGLDSPRLRLAVPRFFFNGNSNGDSSGSAKGEVPKLTAAERRTILDHLARGPRLQQQVAPQMVTVLIHGAECARLDANRDSSQRLEIQEGIKLIEFWLQDQGEKVLLATHWVDYTEWQGIARSVATVGLGSDRELVLETVPAVQADGNLAGASILLKCRPVSPLEAWGKSLRSLSWWRYTMPRYALALLALVAAGWVVGALQYRGELARQRANADRTRQELVREKAERASAQQQLDNYQGAATTATRLTPDDLRVRGQEGVKQPVVTVPSRPALVILELPVNGRQEGMMYRAALRAFPGKREIVSQSDLKPEPRKGSAVLVFALPSSLLEDGKYYVVDLYSSHTAGKAEKIRTFTFSVQKQ